MNQLDWVLGQDQPNTEQVELQEAKAYELNVLFLRTFTTPAGKEVLKWLTTHTLDTPTWWPGKPTDFGFFREGQNSLMRQIKKKIEDAKTYQEKVKP